MYTSSTEMVDKLNIYTVKDHILISKYKKNHNSLKI